MPRERFKNVTINDREYRIGLVTALEADWILNVGLTHATVEGIYERVQNKLFSECSVFLEKGGERIPVKIFDSGRWLVPDLGLDYDLDSVEQIYEAALEFNIGPFVEKRKARLSAMLQQQTSSQ